ncbi:MAG: hypothetical protein V3R98_14410 [Alphaproteobacteria bacterium]
MIATLFSRRTGAAFLRDRSGGVFIYTAIILPLLIGVAGLSIDVVIWHAHSRIVRTIADAAAMAGALELVRSDGVQLQAAALSDAIVNGLDSGQGDSMTVNNPPLGGSYTGVDAVEVIVQRPAPMFLAQLFLGAPATISARAVVRVDANDTCVYALNPTVASAVKVAGGAQVVMPCGVMANSTNNRAVTVSGAGSCLDATEIRIVGDYSGNCLIPAPTTGENPAADPLAALPPPSYDPSCITGKTKVNAGETLYLSPDHYCGAIEVSGNGTLIFQPGTYILGGGLKFNANSVVSGTDVTFYLKNTSGQSDNVIIAGGADVDLRAPTTGNYAGILFFQDPNATAGVNHNFTGGSTQTLDGILYFPTHDLSFSGGSITDNSPTMIIADTIHFTGGSQFGAYDLSTVETNPLLASATIID